MSAPASVALALAAGLVAFALTAELAARGTVRALGWIDGRAVEREAKRPTPHAGGDP